MYICKEEGLYLDTEVWSYAIALILEINFAKMTYEIVDFCLKALSTLSSISQGDLRRAITYLQVGGCLFYHNWSCYLSLLYHFLFKKKKIIFAVLQ